MRLLRAGTSWFRGHNEDAPQKEQALNRARLAYLDTCSGAINAELESQRRGKSPQPITLPKIESAALPASWDKELAKHPHLSAVRTLLSFSGRTVRVIAGHGSGVVWYDITLARMLENVFVLDASWPIRKLTSVSGRVQAIEGLDEKALSSLKDYSTLRVRQLALPGSRSAMNRELSIKYVAQEIMAVVKRIPDDEGVILFTYKPRQGQIDSAKTIHEALKRADVDTTATIDGKPRFVWLTFGQETAINDHAYCKHVIFVGVLRRHMLDLAGALLGETGDLGANVSAQQLKDLMNGEMDHTIYQGLSRGCSRITREGKAAPSVVWLVHDDMSMRFRFEELLKNVQWEAWVPQATLRSCDRARDRMEAAELLQRIQEYLQSLPPGVKKLSTRKLKLALQAEEVESLKWSRAIKLLDERSGWKPDGRSLHRTKLIAVPKKRNSYREVQLTELDNQ